MKKFLSSVCKFMVALLLMTPIAHGMDVEGEPQPIDTPSKPLLKRKMDDTDNIDPNKRQKTSDLASENADTNMELVDRIIPDPRLSGNFFPNSEIDLPEEIIGLLATYLDSNSRKNLSEVNFKFNIIVKKYTQHLGILFPDPNQDEISKQYPDLQEFISKLSHHFPHLTSLKLLKHCEFSPIVLAQFPRLKKLRLSGNGNQVITDDILGQFTGLVSLTIARGISDKLVMMLTNLTNLDLSFNKRVTNKSLTMLTNLTSLDLVGNKIITDESLKMLTKLTKLNLQHNYRIKGESLGFLPNLTELNLGDNGIITDEHMMLLTNLRILNLEGDHQITGKSLGMFPNLIELDISENRLITDNDLMLLTNLKKLTIYEGPKISDASLSYLTNLTYLDMEAAEIVTSSSLCLLVNLRFINLGYYPNKILGLQNFKKLRAHNQSAPEMIEKLLGLLKKSEIIMADDKKHIEFLRLKLKYQKICLRGVTKASAKVGDYMHSDFEDDEDYIYSELYMTNKAQVKKVQTGIKKICEGPITEVFSKLKLLLGEGDCNQDEACVNNYINYYDVKEIAYDLFNLYYNGTKKLKFEEY